MFTKTGAVFTICDVNRIKTASEWDDISKKSMADGITIHKRLEPNSEQRAVCEIDLSNYIYIHTTIMASVDLESNSDHYITRATEKYINTNGDSWIRDVLLNDYKTFIDSGTVYVEHNQNPEHAKGKVLDAIPRDMGDTILIDLLFCVDRRHEDLVHNIETGLANAVSMGCTTKYTICSICGNVAHDEKEYCRHIKSQKNQMVRCDDNVYRKVCELCFENTFYDCSIVANPAFAGAVFRKLVAADKVSQQLLSNILCRRINSMEYENEILKLASGSHPIERKEDTKDYEPKDRLADIPWTDPKNTLKTFDEQQFESVINAGKGKKKIAKCEDHGSLVILTSQHNIQPSDRVASSLFNFITKDTVGRLVGREDNTCAIYFPKIGMIKNIPSSIVSKFSIEDFKNNIKKQAKMSKEEIIVERQGTYLPTNEKFQVLKVDENGVEVRWIEGSSIPDTKDIEPSAKLGTKEILSTSAFNEKDIKWAKSNNLVKFSGVWSGKEYQLKKASWNEKCASILDEFETHIDNVQHDIMSIKPRIANRKYDKSFNIKTKFGSTALKFDTAINGNNIDIDVQSVTW